MKKSSLKFNEDGTAVQIIFKEGSESTAFYSKKEALNAVTETECANDKKLTQEESQAMRDEILAAENLPWGAGRIMVGIIGIGRGPSILDMLFGRNPLEELLELVSVERDFGDIEALKDNPVTAPTFRKCSCGGKHGRIYTTKVMTDVLGTKENLTKVLANLVEKKHITEEEALVVAKEIEDSDLPVNKEELEANKKKQKASTTA